MQITKKNIIELSAISKTEALQKIANYAQEKKLVSSASALFQAFEAREKQFSTGFENGFAIPHARIAEVKETTLLIVRFKKGVQWKAIDGKLTKVAIALIVKKEQDANATHLKMLSQVAQGLLDAAFCQVIKKGKVAEINEALKKIANQEEKQLAKSKSRLNKKVVAITACATGIAHTFMAAQKLAKIAPSQGYEIKVQKNGASGPEDILTNQEIAAADYVIIAADVKVDLAPFAGKKMVQVPVAYAIKNPEQLFVDLPKTALPYQEAENNWKSKKNQSAKTNQSWIYRNVLTHIMNGVSYMIPLLVSAGVLLFLGKLFGAFTGDIKIIDDWSKLVAEGHTNGWYKFAYTINILGVMTLWLIYPIFGLFMAQSIGGKSAVVPGFMIGILSDGEHLFSRIWRTFNDTNPDANPFMSGDYPYVQMSSGFFGALIGALFVGYVVFYLNKWIKIKGHAAPLKGILLVPGIAIFIGVITQIFVINPPFALLNELIAKVAHNSTSFVIAFSMLVAFCTAFDMGGPINKSVSALSISLAAEGIIPLTARTLSIVIPPLGLGLATLIARPFFKKNLYDEDLKVAGRTSIFLGLIAITEGGLPFLFKNPISTIISTTLGAMLGSLFALLIGVHMWQPLPAVYGWPLVGQAPIDAEVTSHLAAWAQILLYIVAVIIGAVITALTNIGLRLAFGKFQKQKDLKALKTKKIQVKKVKEQ